MVGKRAGQVSRVFPTALVRALRLIRRRKERSTAAARPQNPPTPVKPVKILNGNGGPACAKGRWHGTGRHLLIPDRNRLDGGQHNHRKDGRRGVLGTHGRQHLADHATRMVGRSGMAPGGTLILGGLGSVAPTADHAPGMLSPQRRPSHVGRPCRRARRGCDRPEPVGIFGDDYRGGAIVQEFIVRVLGQSGCPEGKAQKQQKLDGRQFHRANISMHGVARSYILL